MSKNINRNQSELLLDFMKANSEIACGLTRQNKYRVAALWKEVTDDLNAAGPPIKTTFEWKKVWIDQKRYVRKKAVQNLQHSKGTGGGPNRQQSLTPNEEAIFSLIGTQEALGGVENSKVFGIKNQTNEELTIILDEILTPTQTPITHVDESASDCVSSYTPKITNVDESASDCVSSYTPKITNVDESASDCVSSYTPKMKKRKLSTSDAVKTELENQKQLCQTIAEISANMEKWHKETKCDTRRMYKALEKANELKEKEFILKENHFKKIEELKKKKLEQKLEINAKLLEIENLKASK